MGERSEVVICGAGIAGVSAAYFLSVRCGMRDVLLVDYNPPLSLTSDRSSECYRNWWPDPPMVALMNRSIDLLEELADVSGNAFHLNRRGYLYCIGQRENVENAQLRALHISGLGGGPLRLHRGAAGDPPYVAAAVHDYIGQPDGADLILDHRLLQEYFPYLSSEIVAALHVRRAGWFSAQQLGMYLLAQARAAGVRLLNGCVHQVEVQNQQVRAVVLDDGNRIKCRYFINAAGPLLQDVGRMVGVELPVYNELHLKAMIKDHLQVLTRDAPLLIWDEPQSLVWNDDERELLADDANMACLLGELPAGAHTRPEGGVDSQVIMVLWDYHTETMEPVWPAPVDPQFAEIATRGLVRMIPDMQGYVERPPRPQIDGGYYTRTQENRPLVGRLPVDGAFVIGALSGFGLMAACACGDLLAAQITQGELPEYTAAFSLERYDDPAYMEMLREWGDTGQL